jgi:hypothetical protein
MPEFPVTENNPLEITVISRERGLKLTQDHLQIPLTEDVVIDDVWHGLTTAAGSGWHELLVVPDTGRFIYFTHPPGAWNSLQQVQQIESTRAASQSAAVLPNARLEEHPIHQLIFYLLFLFAAGLLWLAPKL